MTRQLHNRLVVTPCARHNCSCITASTPNSAPTVRPVFPPGQMLFGVRVSAVATCPHALSRSQEHTLVFPCPCVRATCPHGQWGRRKCSPAVACALALSCLMHAMLALVARKSRVLNPILSRIPALLASSASYTGRHPPAARGTAHDRTSRGAPRPA